MRGILLGLWLLSLCLHGRWAGWSEDKLVLVDMLQPLLSQTNYVTPDKVDDVAEFLRFFVSASFARQDLVSLTAVGYDAVTRETPHPNAASEPVWCLS